MTPLFKWLQNNQHRLRRWTRIFTGFALVQLLVQVLNALAGFLVIRTLEKPPYAWFTVATGMSAALAILADAGLASAVTSIGGKVWQDKLQLSNLIAAALKLRRYLAFFAVALVTPFSVWLLIKNGTSTSDALLLTLVALIPVWQITTNAVLNVVNRLASRSRQLQLADTLLPLTRTVLILALLAIGWLSPLTAVLAAVIAQGMQYLLIRHQVLPLINAPTDAVLLEGYHRQLLPLVRHLYPNALFTCIQGQLSIWIISVFATVTQVADYGALSRFALLFTTLAGPLNQWISPAFARADSRRRLTLLLLGTLTLLATAVTPLLLIGFVKPTWLLALLGPGYHDLSAELQWMFALMTVHLLMSSVWGLCMARGWVKTIWLNIPVTLAAQVIALQWISVSTVIGVAQFGLAVAATQLVHALSVAAIHLHRQTNDVSRSAGNRLNRLP